LKSHKKNLEKIAYEQNTRFQYLHSERAEVIKKLYNLLVDLDGSLHSALRTFQAVGELSLVDKVNIIGDNYNSFREYYLPNKIYFDNDLCQIIEGIIETAKGVFFDITTYEVDTSGLNERYHGSILRERHEFWEKARKIHEYEISSLKVKLEEEFRKILGI